MVTPSPRRRLLGLGMIALALLLIAATIGLRVARHDQATWRADVDAREILDVDSSRILVQTTHGVLVLSRTTGQPLGDPAVRRRLIEATLFPGGWVGISYEPAAADGSVAARYSDDGTQLWVTTVAGVRELLAVDPTGTVVALGGSKVVTGVDVADGRQRWSIATPWHAQAAGQSERRRKPGSIVLIRVSGHDQVVDVATGRTTPLGGSLAAIGIVDGSRWVGPQAGDGCTILIGDAAGVRHRVAVSTAACTRVTVEAGWAAVAAGNDVHAVSLTDGSLTPLDVALAQTWYRNGGRFWCTHLDDRLHVQDLASQRRLVDQSWPGRWGCQSSSTAFFTYGSPTSTDRRLRGSGVGVITLYDASGQCTARVLLRSEWKDSQVMHDAVGAVLIDGRQVVMLGH